MSLNAIVNRIIRAREEAGMSQMELSRKIGAVSNTIQKVESGFIKNPEKYVPDVAKALQKPLSYFFGEDNPELTAFAEKAKKFDELSSLIQASGILAGGGDSNVIVNGHANNVVVNPDTKRLIEEIMLKDKEEREMILRILELEKDEKEKLLELYAVINRGESIPKSKKKSPPSKSK
jgi:transcriptional regulator with XRE-family HTH domain